MAAGKTRAKLDTGHHDRRLAKRLREDPVFRAEFERQAREIAQIDASDAAKEVFADVALSVPLKEFLTTEAYLRLP